MTPIKLTSWACGVASDNPFDAPEISGISLRGTNPDGRRLTTSRVVEKLGPRTFRTWSGSIYELEGDPEPEYVKFCEGIGKPLNLDDPIKMTP